MTHDKTLNFSFDDVDPHNGRVMHNGEQVNGIAGVTIRITPDDLIRAELDVYLSHSNVSAISEMLPKWEVVTEDTPKNGIECLFLLDGFKITGERTHKGWLYTGGMDYSDKAPAKFIPLSWLDD